MEDNPADVYLMRNALCAWPVRLELQILGDGEVALETLLAHDHPPPELVLLDTNLPRLSGTAVLEAIRRNTCLSTVPVVLLSSARPADEAAEQRRSLFLLKPWNLDEYTALSDRIYRFWCDCVSQPDVAQSRPA